MNEWTHTVKENGKNGTVAVYSDRLVRTIKKMVGKDDVQTIPVKGITEVHHNRKTLGADTVTVSVGLVSYEWKTGSAETLTSQLNSVIYA